ncbi:MAG: DUF5686 family protein [Sphingobacteriia bacterium]
MLGQDAQPRYRVTGRVVDAAFGNPLELATVQVDSLRIGGNSNLDGEWSLLLPPGQWQVRALQLGYLDASITVVVQDADVNGLEIRMAPRDQLDLETITVSGKESPANRIIKNATRNRDENRLEGMQAYEYESYNKTTLTLDNISREKAENSLLLRPARGYIREHARDTAMLDTTGRFKVGVFVNETISRVYERAGRPRKEYIIATKGSGFESAETGLVNALLVNADFYNSYVTILEREFLSPIAPGALMNYRFYWTDTVVEANSPDTLYGIQIVPKRPYDRVFKGWIYIQGGSWAIRRIDVSMNADPNINFIEDIRIKQEFAEINGRWVPTLKDIQIDFKNNEDRVGFLGRSITFNKDFVLNQPKEDAFYEGVTLVLSDSATTRDSTYWVDSRQSPLERSDQLAYGLVDHIQALPIWKIIKITQEFFATGKKRVGVVNIGPYSKVVGFNQVEGLRTQLGVYSNDRLSDRFSFGTRGAYGFDDQRWKYGGEVMYRFKRLPDIRAGISYYNDIEQIGIANYELDGTGLLNSVLQYRPLTQLNYYREFKGFFQADVSNGLNAKLQYRQKFIEPAFPIFFQEAGKPIRSDYQVAEVGTIFRISIKEDFVIKKTGKVYTKSKYPITYLEYYQGFRGLAGGEWDYQKAQITVSDKLEMGRFGWLSYTLSAGRIYGNLPYPSLYVYQGSQSLAMYVLGGQQDVLRSFLGVTNRTAFYQSVNFNLMYFYEFVADQYTVAGFDYHLEGYLFNKLPLLRWVLNKLDWKEVITLRLASGSISKENRQLNSPPGAKEDPEQITIKAPDKVPYIEYGVGIENIFKLLRVDYVRRLNYLNPDTPKSLENFNLNWGLRFSLNFTF